MCNKVGENLSSLFYLIEVLRTGNLPFAHKEPYHLVAYRQTDAHYSEHSQCLFTVDYRKE